MNSECALSEIRLAAPTMIRLGALLMIRFAAPRVIRLGALVLIRYGGLWHSGELSHRYKLLQPISPIDDAINERVSF